MKPSHLLITTLALSLPVTAQIGWSDSSGATAPNINSLAIAYDTARDQVVGFTGSQTWLWDGIAWQQVTTATTPQTRTNHAMAYDEARQQIVMFGGRSGPVDLGDTWLWDGTDWSEASPFSSPAARSEHAMDYVDSRQRVVLVGGTSGTNQVWEWSGTNWVQRFPSAPQSLQDHGMAYDAGRDRLVVFSTNSRTYEWDGNSWTTKTTTSAPSNRLGISMEYSPSANRVVLFGGYTINPPPLPPTVSVRNDHWEWDGVDWVAKSLVRPPQSQFRHLTYHGSRQKVLLQGAGTTWEYGLGSARDYTLYGQGCQGSHGGTPQMTVLQEPVLGSRLRLGLIDAPPTTVAALMFGGSQVSIPLNPAGAPGCTLETNPIASFTMFTDLSGTVVNPLQFYIPPLTEFLAAQFHNQWAVFDNGANSLGLIFSGGGVGTAGF